MRAGAPHRVERRLAAIIAADVAGYSRLMGADEEGTLRRLQAHRHELIDPKLGEHHGRMVKTAGDGMIIEFGSVVDAVRCAVEVQRGMAERERETTDEQRIRLRIGINLGDIIIDRGDIFGDGVNVAARLEALAEPGGICLSGIAHGQVREKLPYTFADLGLQSVKNIAQPVHMFAIGPVGIAETPLTPVRPLPRVAGRRTKTIAALGLIALIAVLGTGWWTLPREQSPSPAIGDAKPAPRLSIVVLPFANLSNDPEQDYFVEAITDNLTTDLSRIDGSFVIARTTAFTYKGKSIGVKQIGRDLGVRYVLEGSVRRLGGQVEVNVQLIDAESGAHVWADRFDTDRANLVKAQEEITSRLARTLNIALIQTAGRQIDPEKNPDAQDLIMRGWALFYAPQAHWQDAQQAFEKALELDPQSTGAKIALARMLAEGIPRGLSKSREQDIARAEKLITAAIQQDTSAGAYHALGLVHRLQNRLAESRSEFEKAISLNPNYSPAVLQLGIVLLFSGEPELAMPHLEKASRLTPNTVVSHFNYYWLGFAHLLMNQSDQAVDYLRKACAAGAGAPQLPGYRLTLASALGLKGDIEEAKTTLAEAIKLRPNLDSMTKLLNPPGLREPGNPKFFSLRKNTYEAGLRLAGMPEQ